MGHITTDYIKSLHKDIPNIFIETGTFKGGIPQKMLEDGTFNQWNKVYTIELSMDMCKIASKRYSLFEEGKSFDVRTNEMDETFSGRKEFFDGKLVLIQGDSSKKLEEVLSEIDEPCVFWLDAHAGSKKGYARGDVDCPLINELTIIKKFNKHKHLITIDDADIFGRIQKIGDKVVCDYSAITKPTVESLIEDIDSNFSINYPSPFGQLMLTAINRSEDVETKSVWWME